MVNFKIKRETGIHNSNKKEIQDEGYHENVNAFVDMETKKKIPTLASKKTKTSILREEMNAGKGAKKGKTSIQEEENNKIRIMNMEQNREINSLQLHVQELRSQLDSIETNNKRRLKEILNNGSYMDDGNQNFIIAGEKEMLKKEEDLFKRFQEELREVTNEKDALTDELNELKENISKHKDEIEKLKFDNDVVINKLKNEKENMLEQQLNQYKGDLKNEKEKVVNFCKIIKDQYAINIDEMDSNTSHSNASHSLDDVVYLLNKTKIESETIVNTIENDNIAFKNKNLNLTNENKELNSTVELLKKEVASAKDRLNAIKKNTESMECDLKQKIERLEHAVKGNENMLTERGETINQYMNNEKKYKITRDSQVELINELKAKIISLENAMILLTNEIELFKKNGELTQNKFDEETKFLTSQILLKDTEAIELKKNLTEASLEEKNTLENEIVENNKNIINLEANNKDLTEEVQSKEALIKRLNSEINECSLIANNRNKEIINLQKDHLESQNKLEQEIKILLSKNNTLEENIFKTKNEWNDKLIKTKLDFSDLNAENEELKMINTRMKEQMISAEDERKESNQKIEELHKLNTSFNDQEFIIEEKKATILQLEEDINISNEVRTKIKHEFDHFKSVCQQNENQFKKKMNSKDDDIEMLYIKIEDDKLFHEDLLSSKIKEILSLQNEIDEMHNLHTKKDADLRLVNDEFVKFKKADKLKDTNYKLELEKKNQTQEKEFEDQITELEVSHEQEIIEQVEETKMEYEKKIEYLNAQRDELVAILKQHNLTTEASSQPHDSARYSSNTNFEYLNQKIHSNVNFIQMMKEFVENDQLKRSCSHQEIVSSLNQIINKMNENHTNSRNNSRSNGYFNTASSLNCSSTSSVNQTINSYDCSSTQFNTTWPTLKLYNNSHTRRSYDSLITNQNILKENIEKLKFDITLKLQNLQQIKTNNILKYTDQISNQYSDQFDNLHTEINKVENKLSELNKLFKKLNEEHAKGSWNENIEIWRKRACYRLRILQQEIDNQDFNYAPFQSLVIFRPSDEEVQSIISSVNEKFNSSI